MSKGVPDPSAESSSRWVADRVRAVADGLLWRGGDGAVVSVVRVEPVAMGLLSEREQVARVEGLHEALHVVTGAFQIVSVQRAVDLDAYLADLDGTVRDATAPQQRALAREYREYVRGLVSGGEVREQRYYLLLGPDPTNQGAWKEPDASKAGVDMVAALGKAGLTAHVADATEIVDLLATALQPGRRADEPVVEPARLPVWGRGVW